jgi:hypothetical protein
VHVAISPRSQASEDLFAAENPESFDRYASRRLSRWLSEAPSPTIEVAAELAATLADLPSEPALVEMLQNAC